MLLANLADLAALTRKPSSDPLVELALRRASSRFEGETERVFSLSERTEVHDGDGTAIIRLRAVPVVDPVTVTVLEDVDTVLDGTEYTINPSTGMIALLGARWPSGVGNIRVTYTSGYEGPQDVPGDIQDAVLEHAVTLALAMAHVQQNSAGSTQESYDKSAMVGVTQKWADTVARYRLGGHN